MTRLLLGLFCFYILAYYYIRDRTVLPKHAIPCQNQNFHSCSLRNPMLLLLLLLLLSVTNNDALRSVSSISMSWKGWFGV